MLYREQVEQRVFNTSKGDIKITVILGCSEIGKQHETIEQWIESADSALYQAKHNGRNQTVIAD